MYDDFIEKLTMYVISNLDGGPDLIVMLKERKGPITIISTQIPDDLTDTEENSKVRVLL